MCYHVGLVVRRIVWREAQEVVMIVGAESHSWQYRRSSARHEVSSWTFHGNGARSYTVCSCRWEGAVREESVYET